MRKSQVHIINKEKIGTGCRMSLHIYYLILFLKQSFEAGVTVLVLDINKWSNVILQKIKL